MSYVLILWYGEGGENVATQPFAHLDNALGAFQVALDEVERGLLLNAVLVYPNGTTDRE